MMASSAPVAVLPTPPRRDADEFILPHNLDAERATLGAALLSADAADFVCDRLTADSYFRRAHATLYQAIRAVRDRRAAVDFVTLKQQLTAMAKLDDVGGPAYLAQLVDGIPRSSNVQHYADILRDLQAKRALAAHAHRTLDLVAEGAHSAAAILVDADRRLMDLQAGHTAGRMRAVSETIGELMTDLEWRSAHRGELTGIDTGYTSINELTLGWQRGDLVIIAARPSIGKTTFVINSAIHAARTLRADGAPIVVAVFSLEMRRRQLEYRMLAQLSGVPLSRILAGYMTPAEEQQVAEAMGALAALRVEIDDRGGQTVWDIRAACRRLRAEGGLDLIVVDYVQLIPGTLDRRGANRNEELTDVSRRLKALADEVNAPVLALSQLSRKGQDRVDQTPRLSDLRESGALEQDADIVAFLHRKNHREGGTTAFILEKQRNGATGTVHLSLDRDVVTFHDGGAPPAEEPAAKKPPKKKTVTI